MDVENFSVLLFFLEWTRSQKSRTPNNLKEKWSWPRKQQSNIFCVRFGNFIYTIAISGFRAVSLFFCRSALILIYLYFFSFICSQNHLIARLFILLSVLFSWMNARVCVCAEFWANFLVSFIMIIFFMLNFCCSCSCCCCCVLDCFAYFVGCCSLVGCYTHMNTTMFICECGACVFSLSLIYIIFFSPPLLLLLRSSQNDNDLFTIRWALPFFSFSLCVASFL